MAAGSLQIWDNMPFLPIRVSLSGGFNRLKSVSWCWEGGVQYKYILFWKYSIIPLKYNMPVLKM